MRVFLRVLNFRDKEVQTQVKLDEMDWKDGELKVLDSHIEPVTLDPLTIRAVDAEQKEAPTRTPGEKDVTFELSNIDDGSNRALHAPAWSMSRTPSRPTTLRGWWSESSARAAC